MRDKKITTNSRSWMSGLHSGKRKMLQENKKTFGFGISFIKRYTLFLGLVMSVSLAGCSNEQNPISSTVDVSSNIESVEVDEHTETPGETEDMQNEIEEPKEKTDDNETEETEEGT